MRPLDFYQSMQERETVKGATLALLQMEVSDSLSFPFPLPGPLLFHPLSSLNCAQVIVAPADQFIRTLTRLPDRKAKDTSISVAASHQGGAAWFRLFTATFHTRRLFVTGVGKVSPLTFFPTLRFLHLSETVTPFL